MNANMSDKMKENARSKCNISIEFIGYFCNKKICEKCWNPWTRLKTERKIEKGNQFERKKILRLNWKWEEKINFDRTINVELSLISIWYKWKMISIIWSSNTWHVSCVLWHNFRFFFFKIKTKMPLIFCMRNWNKSTTKAYCFLLTGKSCGIAQLGSIAFLSMLTDHQ